MIIAQGRPSAAGLCTPKTRKPTYCHNLLGLQRFKVIADKPVPPGAHQVRTEFDHEGGGPGKGGWGPPLHRRQPCRRGKLPATVPLIFSADETVDLGRDTGSPVSDDYTPATSVFTGTVG